MAPSHTTKTTHCAELRFFLPINDIPESFAAQAVLGEITAERHGFTRSPFEGDVFKGRFWDEKRGYVDDDVLLVIVLTSKLVDVDSFVAHMHEFIHDSYVRRRRAQHAVWIARADVLVAASVWESGSP